LQSSLLIHEQKLNQQDKKEQALQVLSNNHFLGGERRGRRTHNNNGRFSHQKFKDNHSSNSQTREKEYDNNHLTFYKPKPMNKSKVKCFRCHMYWHYKSKCHANLNRNDGKSNFTLMKEKMSLLMAYI